MQQIKISLKAWQLLWTPCFMGQFTIMDGDLKNNTYDFVLNSFDTTSEKFVLKVIKGKEILMDVKNLMSLDSLHMTFSFSDEQRTIFNVMLAAADKAQEKISASRTLNYFTTTTWPIMCRMNIYPEISFTARMNLVPMTMRMFGKIK